MAHTLKKFRNKYKSVTLSVYGHRLTDAQTSSTGPEDVKPSGGGVSQPLGRSRLALPADLIQIRRGGWFFYLLFRTGRRPFGHRSFYVRMCLSTARRRYCLFTVIHYSSQWHKVCFSLSTSKPIHYFASFTLVVSLLGEELRACASPIPPRVWGSTRPRSLTRIIRLVNVLTVLYLSK